MKKVRFRLGFNYRELKVFISSNVLYLFIDISVIFFLNSNVDLVYGKCLDANSSNELICSFIKVTLAFIDIFIILVTPVSVDAIILNKNIIKIKQTPD